MKQKLLFIGVTLWLIAIFQIIEHNIAPADNEQSIAAAFSDTDFSGTESCITATAIYPADYLTAEKREDILIEIARDLDISTSLVYDSEQTENGTVSTLIRTGSRTKAVFRLITTETEVSDAEISLQHRLTVELSFDQSLKSAFYYKDLIESVFTKHGMTATITIALNGQLSGNLTITEKNMLTQKLLDNVDGTIVTGCRDDELYCVYAYTQNLEEYILLDEQKANLNLIISYNELRNITEVSLVTPFQNEDF